MAEDTSAPALQVLKQHFHFSLGCGTDPEDGLTKSFTFTTNLGCFQDLMSAEFDQLRPSDPLDTYTSSKKLVLVLFFGLITPVHLLKSEFGSYRSSLYT
ncbi:hypothetical protein Tco_1135343 [Tanacetum coccineum]